MMSEVKLGLALGGGFFRGIAHIGALQVLEEHGLRADMCAGTSMGAVVGALYATGMDMYLLEKFAYSIREGSLFDLTIPRRGFIKGNRIDSFMMTLTGNRDFSQTKIPFAAVACDIESGERVVIDSGKLYRGVRASISVPGVFVPVERDGRLLVDGGVVDRVPASVVRAMGADVVLAIDVTARTENVKVSTTFEAITRMYELMEDRSSGVNLHAEDADVLVTPPLRHINHLSLSQADECLRIGREEMEARMDDLIAAMERASQAKAAGAEE